MAIASVNAFGSGRNPQINVVALNITGDTSYTTGGSSLPADAINGVALIGVSSAHPQQEGTTDRTYVWDNSAQKLKAFLSSTGAQVAAATDLSADRVTLLGVVI